MSRGDSKDSRSARQLFQEKHNESYNHIVPRFRTENPTSYRELTDERLFKKLIRETERKEKQATTFTHRSAATGFSSMVDCKSVQSQVASLNTSR